MHPTTQNADPAELAKFSALAQSWWDPKGPSKPLHDLNPLRLRYIERAAGLSGKQVLDVGCGGGILSEAMARAGARVLGIDLSKSVLEVAELHALEGKVPVEYRVAAAEELAERRPAAFDVVTCMEMLEHVPEPAAMTATLARLLRPGGALFVSTINRNLRAFLLAIVGAEYLLNLIPRGTHEYERLIRPAELARWARAAGLTLVSLAGIELNPFTERVTLSRSVAVNYLAHFRAPEPSP
jgi:2-polyprenyl-6-hydroxyphenyl methylase/3-demethylubiquinone-9 3-methyltransferase